MVNLHRFRATFVPGTVLLISFDKIRFRVDKQQLMGDSTKFSDLIGAQPENREIHIELIEHSDVLSLYLDVLEGDRIFDGFRSWDRSDERRLQQLFKFAQKYGCAGVVRRLAARSEAALADPRAAPLPLFIFAAHTNNVALCCDVLRHFAFESWIYGWKGGNGAWPTFDFANLPAAVCNSLPFDYVWALAQAAGTCDPKGDKRGFIKTFADCIVPILSREDRVVFPQLRPECIPRRFSPIPDEARPSHDWGNDWDESY